MIEVEYKYAVESAQKMRDALAGLNAKLIQRAEQMDVYFNHSEDDFKQKDIAFRIRQSDGSSFLTYKGPNKDDVGKIRDEVEMPLVDEKSAAQMQKILESVGFHVVSSVTKNRTRYRVDILGWAIEACVDEVEGLGEFVELEVLCEDESQVEQAKQSIEYLALHLKVNDPIRTSYLDLLMNQC